MILTSFNDPIPFESREVAESLSFTYHINTFDYPILHGHKDIWEFTLMTNGAIENQLNGKVTFVLQEPSSLPVLGTCID